MSCLHPSHSWQNRLRQWADLRRPVVVLSLSITLVMAPLPAGASAPNQPAVSASFIRADACAEHQAFFDGDPAAVAARLPDSYTPATDPASGKPLLFARAEHCRITVNGTTTPATIAVFGIVINSPDGRGCASGIPTLGEAAGQLPPVCNWYPIEWLASDQRVVNWLSADSPGPTAVLVPGLAFSLSPADSGAVMFHFAAPAPAPSPFSMEDAGHPGLATINVRGGYWMGTGARAMKIAFSTDDITPGQATGSVRAAPGSPAAELMGSTGSSYAAEYQAIAGERWAHGSYRKQLLGPAPGTHSFSGSCSISGTDTFDPPASNTPQDLHVSYDATGTCSGSLDGHQLSNAPVSWHSEGYSYGTCAQANTTQPGTASMTFPNGASIQSTFDFSSLLTQINMSYYGVRSGFAAGQATFLTPRTGPDAVINCAGPGDRRVPMDLTLSTDSPLVSPDQPDAAGGGRPPVARTLHIAVRPHTARAGVPTRLRFTVTGLRHQPVASALVIFDGRRAHTNSRGVALMRVRLGRHGRLVAIARKPGFRAARTALRVFSRRE